MQRAEVGASYSDWFQFIRGVPQASILGSLLFNIFLLMKYFLKYKNPTFVTLQMIKLDLASHSLIVFGYSFNLKRAAISSVSKRFLSFL